MISIKTHNNTQEMYSCNSCHNFKEHKMYELLIGFGNGGQLMYLCPKCLEELKIKVNRFNRRVNND